MKKIAFRTMGGQDIGYGHLFRCLSLAKALKKESLSYKIYFIVNQEVKNIVVERGFEFFLSNNFEKDFEIFEKMWFDLIIVDSYRANDHYLKSIKKITKLMLFDDNNDIYDSGIPDIVLNGNIHAKDLAYKIDSPTHFFLGSEYLVMQEEYWNNTLNKYNEKKGILITTGGSDAHNISPEILKEIVKTDYLVTLIVGPGYSKETVQELHQLKNNKTTIMIKPNGLKDYIKNSEYVITSCGSTVYEVLSQESIPIIFTLAENQKIAYNYFRDLGVETLGQYPNIRYNEIIQIFNQPQKMHEHKLSELYKTIDGKGALRVSSQIIQFLNSI